MSITPYQIIVPVISLIAMFYALSLFLRQKKSFSEMLLWTVFWLMITTIALFPNLLSYLSALTGIKSQQNAFLVTAIGILSFITFSIIVRLEELRQKQTRIIRAMALKDLDHPPHA